MSSSDRYARQRRLPEIGPEGQARLAQSRVALVGLGALGSVSADLLARAGVGFLRLIDRDVVEASNLQRQSLYTTADAEAGALKALAAAERLRAVNPEVALDPVPGELHAGSVAGLMEGIDLIVDGSDNFPTRYLLNDFAVASGTPFIYAGVVATYGMAGAITATGPCLRCLWPEPPPASETETCTSAGVLGPAVAVVAGWAAALALRALVDGELPPTFSSLDPWHGQAHPLQGTRDPACPCCHERDFPWLEGRRDAPTAEVACAGNAVRLPGPPCADLSTLATKLEGGVTGLRQQASFLRFQHGEHEVLLFADGQRLVRGTSDPARARAVLAETLGQ